jgi:hypothetical protein
MDFFLSKSRGLMHPRLRVWAHPPACATPAPRLCMPSVTDLQGPPSERTQTEKLRDLKTLAQQYARDRGSCDDTQISYLEFLESEAEDDLTLARMISG